MGKIIVTGASGNIGKKTIMHLLERTSPTNIVGLVRDLVKAADLAHLGIELRQGDYLHPDSLRKAFFDIEKVMLTATHAFTDRNTAHANVIDAAVMAGVRHMVFMPVMRKPNSTLKMKEITEEDMFTQEKLITSRLTYTLVKHPPFLDLLHLYIGPKAQETGVVVTGGNGKFTSATRNDLAEAHAEILVGTGHENKTYVLTGDPTVSYSDIAEYLSEAKGSKVSHIIVSDEEWCERKLAAGFPKYMVDFAFAWDRAVNTGEFDIQTSDLESIIGRKPQSPKNYFQNDYQHL